MVQSVILEALLATVRSTFTLETFFMACPSGTQNIASARKRLPENLASVLTEVLRLCLQATNLPIMGRKAEMISRLKGYVYMILLPKAVTQF